jgi:putative mRNA 3-end processing factor
MEHFETSKGYQDILMTDATKRLLVAEFNADLEFRANIRTLPMGVMQDLTGGRVTLLSSDHMLGSVQVGVELPSGMRVGYSGDFHWPLDRVIEVDALVLDSTYGSPERRRSYSQDEVEGRLLRLVSHRLNREPVHIKAHRGTLQRALQVLSGAVDCAMVGSSRLCAEVEVYRQFGYGIGRVIPVESSEGKAVLAGGRFVRFYGKGDRLPVQPTGVMLTLSAYMSNPDDPIAEFSDRAFGVALSNHADFDGTLAYVEATGAKFVLTDSMRGAHSLELALEIQRRLGKEARPSSHAATHEWGL